MTNSYTFDGAGRLTSQTVSGQNRSYAYSFRSQMTSLTDTNNVELTYNFAGDRNRIKENNNRYVYDGPKVVMELNSGVIQAVYVNGLGIDQPIEKISYVGGVANGRYVYHRDGLGSVMAMTDASQLT